MAIALTVAGAASRASAQTAQNVLVVINEESADSRSVGEYYVQKRQIPAENVVRLQLPVTDEIDRATLQNKIEAPLIAWFNTHASMGPHPVHRAHEGCAAAGVGDPRPGWDGRQRRLRVDDAVPADGGLSDRAQRPAEEPVLRGADAGRRLQALYPREARNLSRHPARRVHRGGGQGARRSRAGAIARGRDRAGRAHRSRTADTW